MKVLFSIMGIAIEGAVDETGNMIYVPTAKELCELDKRLMYIGTVITNTGVEIHDAFFHVLEPTQVYTINDIKKGEDNLIDLIIDCHHLSNDSPVLQSLYEKYRDEEIYVGDVCDGTGYTGEVWHDTYKLGLHDTLLYTKRRDSNNRLTFDIVKPPIKGCFSVPDRFGCRVLVKTPNEPDKHYAFFSGSSALYQWGRLKANAKEGQEVLHSLSPNYKAYFVHHDTGGFDDYPELVKAYPECYSNSGYLHVKKK